MSEGQADKALHMPDAAAIEALLAAAETAPGEWRSPEGVMPHYHYSDKTQRLMAALYGCGLPLACDCTALRDLMCAYRHEPHRVLEADLPTLRRLLFCHLRADRFVEGHLAEALEGGQFGCIVRRVLGLLSDCTAIGDSTTAMEV